MGAMVPPSKKELLQLPSDEDSKSIRRGYDRCSNRSWIRFIQERTGKNCRSVDTPEKRTRDLEEKELGIDATNWMKDKLTETIKGDEELTIRTELKGGVGKYGRLLGWLYIGDADVSLNEQMITEGYAWAYDGGTKQKNFEELREIRRSFGSLVRVT